MENGGAPVYDATTFSDDQQKGKGPSCSGCSIAHLGFWRFLLKVAQLVLSFLGFVCEEVVKECTRCHGLYFFEFVSCSAFLLSIMILVMYCTSLYERTGKERVYLLDLFITAGVGFFFLLASIVFLAINGRTSAEIAAIVFGVLASVAFAVDAGQMFWKKCKARDEKQPENKANTVNTTENQPLNNQQV